MGPSALLSAGSTLWLRFSTDELVPESAPLLLKGIVPGVKYVWPRGPLDAFVLGCGWLFFGNLQEGRVGEASSISSSGVKLDLVRLSSSGS